MAIPVISVENFCYAYRGTSQQALTNVTFSVDEFEFCGLVGPSEAGKTTLCYAIASVLNHYFSGGTIEGKIVTKGLDSLSAPLEVMMRNVGILMQNSSVYLTGIKPTVAEEIAFSMENFGIDRSTMIKRVESSMTEMGVTHLAARHPLSLSGGEMQRVALACVLALDPPILILDEPTSSLDHEGTRDLYRILKKLKGKKSILLIDQRMDLFPGLVDSILVLREGRSVYRGEPKSFFGSPACFEHEVGGPTWTHIYYHHMLKSGKQTRFLPYTYREALKQFSESH